MPVWTCRIKINHRNSHGPRKYLVQMGAKKDHITTSASGRGCSWDCPLEEVDNTLSHTHTDSPGNTVVAWFSRHPCVHSDFDMIIYDNDTGSYVLMYYHQTLSHIIFRRGMNYELDLESWMNPWRSAKKLSIVCLRPTIRLFSSPHGRDSNGCKWVTWTGNYIWYDDGDGNISYYTRCIEGTWTWSVHVFHTSLIHLLVRHQWLHIVCLYAYACTPMSVPQKHPCSVSNISTPKVPASFQFQVERSHTLSSWDAIQNASCTWTKQICSSRSRLGTWSRRTNLFGSCAGCVLDSIPILCVPVMRKKSRQRKTHIQKIALVPMFTRTGMAYSMKCLKSSDVVGKGHHQDNYFILNPSWSYSEEFSMVALESRIVCCIVPSRELLGPASWSLRPRGSTLIIRTALDRHVPQPQFHGRAYEHASRYTQGRHSLMYKNAESVC